MAGDRAPEGVVRLDVLLRVGIEAVGAGKAVERVVVRDGGRLRVGDRRYDPGTGVFVLAIGKAAGAMAQAAEARVGADLRGGLVITKDGHALPSPTRLACLEAGHPVPDARSEAAGLAALDLARRVPEDALLLVLLSGGGSALTTTPVAGLGLEELAATTHALLAAGVDIEALNTVRKHVSAIAGGGLAVARGAGPIEVLCVSDVMGDRIDLIASGPCAADPSRAADALEIVMRGSAASSGPEIPEAVVEYLRAESTQERARVTGASADVTHRIIARNADARAAILHAARERGLRAIDLGEPLRGEAREIAKRLVGLARSIECDTPTLLVAGGETVVTVRGTGRGGRSQELALAAAIALESKHGASARHTISLLAAGTDGTDGPTDAAGACADDETFSRALAAGLDPMAALTRNDAYAFFDEAGGLIRTGPTGTNVMDIVLIRVGALTTPSRGRVSAPEQAQ